MREQLAAVRRGELGELDTRRHNFPDYWGSTPPDPTRLHASTRTAAIEDGPIVETHVYRPGLFPPRSPIMTIPVCADWTLRKLGQKVVGMYL